MVAWRDGGVGGDRFDRGCRVALIDEPGQRGVEERVVGVAGPVASATRVVRAAGVDVSVFVLYAHFVPVY